MCMQAVLVVAQDLDDLAVRDCALGALRQHAFQFLLQGLTARNTVLDRDKLAHYSQHTLLQTFKLLLPVTLGVVVMAPWLLPV